MKNVFAPLRRGMKILAISIRRYSANDRNSRAVALTFYTLFAIVPLAALLFGIAKGFELDEKLRVELSTRFAHHQEILQYVYTFADTTLKRAKGGIVAGVGVIALIWTVMSLAGNIERAFNAVWGLPARRNLLRRFSDCLAVLLLTPILLVTISGAGVLLRRIFTRLAESTAAIAPGATSVFSLIADLSPAVIAILFFFVIYLAVPNTKVKWASALFAGAVAGIVFQLLQDSFLLLQRSIYTYNNIYGSFAALPLFLIWLQWSWKITLFGAEVGFVSQHIDSGLFGRKDEGRPGPKLRVLRQLAIVQVICAKLESDDGETTARELAERLGLAPIDIETETKVLLDAGVLRLVIPPPGSAPRSDADRTAFLPAYPPEELTLVKCLRLLGGGGDSSNRFRSEAAELSRAVEELLEQAAADPRNLPLHAYAANSGGEAAAPSK